MSGEGTELSGRYHLAEKIGEGGMGSVWVATDLRAEGDAPREVAVKVLHKTLVTDPAAIARFRHEASVASEIAHPNLCRVLDVGEADGAPFLVMERLHGESLAERLTREQSLAPIAAVEVVLELLAGLEAAHAHGVLHRDLKPENVFLARDGDRVTAKVLDFGVSKFIGDDVARVKMTRTGALVGTPAYMSPEQVLGETDIDVRSDVWAVGVLLYETLVGGLPYDAANYNAMLVKIATESPRPIGAALPSLDAGLCAVVDRALARHRDDRFASAAEMSDALRGWLVGAPSRPHVPRVAMPTPLIGTTPMSWAEQASGEVRAPTLGGHRTPPRKLVWLLPAVLVVVLGVAGVVIAVGVRRTGAAVLPAGRSAPVATFHTAPPEPRAEFRLDVAGVPVGAHVRLNGRDGSLPAVVRRGESARIEITAAGYEPWTQSVAPTGDVTLTFEGRRAMPIVTASAAGDGGLANTPAQDGGVRAALTRRTPRNGRHALQGGVAPHPDF